MKKNIKNLSERELEKKLIKDSEFYKGHSKEFTRRQFLANLGIGFGTAYYAMNFANNPLVSKAYASTQEIYGPLPFVSLDLSGGIAFAANVIVGRDASGTQDFYGVSDGLGIHGIPSDLHPSRNGMVNDSYGVKFHSYSGILQGMNEILDGKKVNINGSMVDIKDMIDGLVFICRSVDDTHANPLNAAIPISIAGNRGQLINVIGTNATDSGGYHSVDPSVYNPIYRSSQVKTFNNAEGLLKVINKDAYPLYPSINSNTTQIAQPTFIDRFKNIAKDHFNKIDPKILNEDTKESLIKSFDETSGYFTRYNDQILNPNKRADTKTIVDTVFPNTADSDEFKQKVGSISHLLMNNWENVDGIMKPLVGAASIQIAGCDYHDGTASSMMKKDLEIGRHIGAMIYFAALSSKNLILDLVSDGSAVGGGIVADDTDLGMGRTVLHSDNPLSSGSLMLVYHHGRRRSTNPIVKKNQNGYLRQVGYFLNVRNGLSDITANNLSNTTSHLWKIKVLNFMALQMNTDDPLKVIERFEEVFGRGKLPSDAASMIRFKYLG